MLEKDLEEQLEVVRDTEKKKRKEEEAKKVEEAAKKEKEKGKGIFFENTLSMWKHSVSVGGIEEVTL